MPGSVVSLPIDESEWLAESARAVYFFASPLAVKPESLCDLWKEASGADSCRLTTTYDGHAVSGDCGDNILILKSAELGQRIDWQLTERPRTDFPPWREAGKLTEKRDRLERVIERFRPHDHAPIVRIGIGFDAYLKATDACDCIRTLSMLTKVAMSPEHTTDFLFQINRRRASLTQAGVTINRFTRFAAAEVILPVPVAGGAILTPKPYQSQGFRSRLEIDLNTMDPDGPDGVSLLAAELFGELLSLSSQILCNGDTP